MNLYHLKTFYYIAKYKSFTRAAKVLCITQPAVTRQIQELQNTHNIALLNVVGKKVVLTDAGESLYALAEKIFDLETQVENNINDFHNQKENIKIASCETFASCYLPYIIKKFHIKFPDIFLSVNTADDFSVMENISDIAVNIGFISCKPDNTRLTVRELFSEELVFVASPQNELFKKEKLHVEDLNNIPMILCENEVWNRKVFKELSEKYHFQIREICKISNNLAVINLVKLNLGISLVAKNTVRSELERGELAELKIPHENLKYTYYMTYYNDKYLTGIIVDFLHVVNKWVAEYMAGGC